MRHTRILLFLLTAMLLTTACYNKKQVQEKPDNLIPRKTLVNILAECYAIESHLQLAPDSINRFDLTPKLYLDLFDRYKVTRTQFLSSVDYYVGNEESADQLLREASVAISEMHRKYAAADSAAIAANTVQRTEKSPVP